jgi:pimeloyl-ACP methyl ester carboxylesterase
MLALTTVEGEGTMKSMVFTALLACTLMAGCATSPQGSGQLVSETFMIPALDPAIQLHVRNKHPAGQDRFAPERILLFVHGATYPSATGFDIDLPGGSWMDYVARRGYDTYFVDIRGYGGSTRPATMNQPPAANPPFADTKDAVRDVAAAVDFILKRRGVQKINLMGWSWGTAIMGGYTAQNNAKVNKLVLYAPLWTLKAPPPISGAGNYRTVERDPARARGLRGIPKGREEEISPTAWFDKWWAGNLASDPEGAKRTPPVVRAPNGVIKDIVEVWGRGKSTWDPSQVRVPTLLVLAEWDQDTPPYMAQEVYANMTNAPYRRLEMLSEGTHAVALEKNRIHLIEQVQNFLEESRR